MVYESKNFDNLLGLKGFSDSLLNNHFKLYQGYVTHTNKVVELLTKSMQEAADLDVPLEIDIGIGNNWDQAH